MTIGRGIAIEEKGERDIPIFTPLHLEYLQAKFGNFKQHQSPATLNDMVKVSHLASEQIGALAVLNHISSLISNRDTSSKSPVLNEAGPAFSTTASE